MIQTPVPELPFDIASAHAVALCEVLALALDEVTRRWAVQRVHVEVAAVREPRMLRLTVTGEPEALPGREGDEAVVRMRRCLRRWDGQAELTLLPIGLVSIRAWLPRPAG
jgi:hypothetical protein